MYKSIISNEFGKVAKKDSDLYFALFFIPSLLLIDVLFGSTLKKNIARVIARSAITNNTFCRDSKCRVVTMEEKM